MSVRACYWTLWLLLGFVLPLPLLGPFDALVPVARFIMLFGFSAAVAIAEGAAGPVPLILLLFAAHALSGLALCALIAWGGARGLSGLTSSGRRALVAVVVLGAVGFVTAFDFYRTPFGRTPSANFWGLFC